jgi:hypothetical protein
MNRKIMLICLFSKKYYNWQLNHSTLAAQQYLGGFFWVGVSYIYFPSTINEMIHSPAFSRNKNSLVDFVDFEHE